MDDINFWMRCVKAECVIVPVPTYSQWGEDDDTHLEHFLGVRYAALRFDKDAVGPDFHIYIDEHQEGRALLYDTPEDALGARIESQKGLRK